MSTYHYYPFGEQASAPATAETMRYTSHERDVNAGAGTVDDLDYMHARYYSPQMGRFLSVDTARRSVQVKNPQTWNRYSYVTNSPLKAIDPDGEAGLIVTAGGGALIGAGVQVATNLWQGKDWGEGVGEAMLLGAALGSGAKLLGAGKNAIQAWRIQRALASGELVAGTSGVISRAALQVAANSSSGTTTVFPNLTQAPQLGRALSVAAGENAAAAANAARKGGQLYEANIPTALIESMRAVGLVERRFLVMGGEKAVEYRFRAEAAEFIVEYFKRVR